MRARIWLGAPLAACYFNIMTLRYSIAGACMLIMASVHAPLLAALPDSFSALYSVHANGMKVAVLERHLAATEDGRYLFESKSRTTGLVSLVRRERVLEQSEWTWAGQQIRPYRYRYVRSGRKEKEVVVEFDYANGRVANTVNDDTWYMQIEPAAFDKLLYQLALTADLAAGKRELEYTIADGGRYKTYHFDVIGDEHIETQLGNLKTLKLQRIRKKDQRKITFWCAPAYQYFPVRVEYEEKDGSVTSVLIESLSGIPADR